MKNDFQFWEQYLTQIKKEIKKICAEKEFLYADLHIHSNYSADGKQSIQEIIDTTMHQGFDVIAITDHDTVNAYDELFEIVKKGLTKPLIIPGIEFTIDNKEYGNQCHFLQLFINPKDKSFLKDVQKGEQALFKRSQIQFKRLDENKTIQYFKKKHLLTYSYEEYLEYLTNNNLVPEYDTLCSYLMQKFIEKNITTFDILDKLEKYNEEDIYEDRKEYKKKRFKKLREKYEANDVNNFNTRFLLSMLAVREVDDDWWDVPSSGSLSVNSYGQLKIEELNNLYPIYFAHPTESKIEVVKEILTHNNKIIGLEENVRNPYEDITKFRHLLKERNLNRITGSDSHDASLQYYNNMEFYKLSKSEVEKIL